MHTYIYIYIEREREREKERHRDRETERDKYMYIYIYIYIIVYIYVCHVSGCGEYESFEMLRGMTPPIIRRESLLPTDLHRGTSLVRNGPAQGYLAHKKRTCTGVPRS